MTGSGSGGVSVGGGGGASIDLTGYATEMWTEENYVGKEFFSSLIPRMSTFTLAISCLTISNLPWFMDLTFQVPMQYCSLQHRTLLLSPVTSTTGYCFWFGSIPLFFSKANHSISWYSKSMP